MGRFGSIIFRWQLASHLELIPAATRIALLVNPTNPVLADTLSRDLEAAARAIGQQIHVVSAGTERDFDTAFTKLVQQGVGALVVGNDPLFNSRPDRLVARAGVSICSD